ncbi:putative SAP domain-containing protein [Seiridium cardinale]
MTGSAWALTSDYGQPPRNVFLGAHRVCADQHCASGTVRIRLRGPDLKAESGFLNDMPATSWPGPTVELSLPEIPPQINPLPHRFQPKFIINLDETPMPFELLDGYTYAFLSSKTVVAKTGRSGWGNRQLTLIPYITADGEDHFDWWVIFHGTPTNEGGKILAREQRYYALGIKVKFNDTAWNNEVLMEEWIESDLAYYWTVSMKRIMMTYVISNIKQLLHTKHKELIIQSFKQCGISVAVDGSEDNLIRQSTAFPNTAKHEEVTILEDDKEDFVPKDEEVEL